MAMTARSVTANYSHSPHTPLLTSINTLLQTLIHQNLNPQNPDFSSPLNQFAPSLNPNLVTEVIKSQTNPQAALLFFRWASNPNPNPNGYVHTQSCYSAMVDLLLSHSLFSTAETLLERSNNLNDFMIGKIIRVHGDRGDIRGAIYWLNRAKMIEGNRCLYSYNSVLAVLVRANRISLARAIFESILKENVVHPDVSTYTVLIRGYCKLGLMEDAKRVFDGMICRPNLITYNTFIAGLCRKGDMKYAREIVDRMIEGKVCLPDTVTFTTLIDGYCKRNELEEAEKCLEEMVQMKCEPNEWTYNALTYGLCMNGKIDEAKRMMSKMRLNGLKDNVVTHTNLLKGFCIVGRSEDAANHLKEMVSLGLEPDAKAYGVVMNEYCKLGRPNDAIAILDQMKLRGLKPGVFSFNALFRVLCDLGQHDHAICYLKEMSQSGCAPNFISYNTVFCSLCSVRGRMKDAEELVVSMRQKGYQPDISMYSTMVKGYCEDGDVQMAIAIYHEMVEKGLPMNIETFSVFVKKLCGKGKASEVKKLFQEMCKRCPISDVNTYKKILDENLCKLWDDLPEYWNSKMPMTPIPTES